MILYVTDNPIIKKDLTNDSFLLYQIFDWRVSENKDIENEFILKAKFKSNQFKKSFLSYTKIVAIITPSNYKLIYDLLYIKKTYFKEIVFYSWDSFSSRKALNFDTKLNTKLFFQYIQRGYLTLLLYKQLSHFNLQRIEQFSLLIATSMINKTMDCGNLVGSLKNYKPKQLELIDTLGILRILCYSGYSIRKAVDKLIYHSRKLDITDPFLGELRFLKEDNSLYKIYTEFKDSPVYLGIDSEFSKDNGCGITAIYELVKGFLPITDLLKTLRFLEKNGILNSINKKCTLEPLYEFNNQDIKQYINYVSPSKWNEIYKSGTYDFNTYFPLISIVEEKYECPLCGSTKLSITPTKFFCSDNSCAFQVNRLIKPGGIKKTIKEKELVRMIKYGDTIIKNKIGGYNRFFLNRLGNRFYVVSQIEKNEIIED